MYYVFAGQQYYPFGGWRDLKEAFLALEEAKLWILDRRQDYDWWHISDGKDIVVYGYN